jgi:cyclopropane-fatty-acyl-phospholipid synthase
MTAPEVSLNASASGASRLGPPAASARIFALILGRYLKSLEHGGLTVTLPSGAAIRHRGPHAGPDAVLEVRRWRTLWRLLLQGDLGLARAYMDGDCETPDLRALLDLGAQNEAVLARTASGSLLSRILERLRHGRRANTRPGSRRNIAEHYDLGNAFYELWLDRGMNYSSALFASADATLEQAQQAKLDRVVELLNVQPDQRVLEIGFGWGALAEQLQSRAGHYSGVTLSTEQLAYTDARLRRRSNADNFDLKLRDYRDVPGTFDRIVSIEMFEAVGERYWPIYFDKLKHALTATGAAVLQVITIAEARFADYRCSPDFIQRYIFPGGMLPTMEILRREAARAGLKLESHDAFGRSYARTLAEWRHRFVARWPDIEALGFDLRFKRMWEYYLAYCEVGFQSGAIDVSLLKLVPQR